MKYEDFTSMALEEMAEIVWAEGIFLSRKKYPNKQVELYSLDNFFAELWFIMPEDIRGLIFLDYIRSFPRIKAIDKYLKDEGSP